MWELIATGAGIIAGAFGVMFMLLYNSMKGTMDKLSIALESLEAAIRAVEDGSREALGEAIREQGKLITALRDEMAAEVKDHEKRLFALSERMHEGQGALLEIKNQVAREYMPVEQLKDNFEKIDVKFDRTDAKFEKSVANIEQTLKLLPELNTKVVMLTAKVDDLSKRT